MKKARKSWPAKAPDDWIPCAIRLPEIGEEVEIAHTHCRFGFCEDARSDFGPATGSFNGAKWTTSEFFLAPNGLIFFSPTHWRPLPSEGRS